jgi:hypothetical protein
VWLKCGLRLKMGMIGNFVWIMWRLLLSGMSEFDRGCLLLPEFSDLLKVVKGRKKCMVFCLQ